jgi:hypothetical protein
MGNDLELNLTMRRRGTMLKLIRQNHEEQSERLDDFALAKVMSTLWHMSQRQVLTMLQDLQIFGLVSFKQRFCNIRERTVAEEIMLTAVGVGLVNRRQDTDEVLFD